MYFHSRLRVTKSTLERIKQRVALRVGKLSSRYRRIIYYACRLLKSKLSLRACHLKSAKPLPKPRKSGSVVWVSQFYNSPNLKRQNEISQCLLRNLELSWITKKLIAVDSKIEFNASNRYQKLALSRLLFSDYLELIDQVSRNDPNSIIILTNSDIALTNDVALLLPWIQERDVICIARHEPNMRGFEYPPEWYQDCWIMRAQPLPPNLINNSKFALGIPGCDNHFAALLHEAGFTIWNPCINTRVYHHHLSSVRTHGSSERIQGAYYEPYACTIEEFIMRQNPGGRLRAPAK